MLYISTTGDLVAFLLIIATFFYLLYSLKSIYIKDVHQVLFSKNTIVFFSLFILFLHYLLVINTLFIQEPTLNDTDNFIWWADQYGKLFLGLPNELRKPGYIELDWDIGEDNYYFTIGAGLFKQFLSIFSIAFGTSSFFLSCLSTSIFAVSLIYFLKICVLLNIRILSGWSIVLFGGVPGFLLITIVPYREVFMILFLMMSIYYGLRYRLENKLLYLAYSIILIVLFGLFHYVLMSL